MNISISALNKLLAKPHNPRAIADALEQAGIEVEQIKYSRPLHENIIVGLVKKVMQHPGADRLRLAEVFTGNDLYKVVCGAPNLEEGQKVVFALPDSVLPDGTHIAVAKIRGEESFGMICSEKELGISDAHEGILVLSDDAAVGAEAQAVLSMDIILDIKTSANRSDLQSLVGVAREAAAILGTKLSLPEIKTLPDKPQLAAKPKDACSRYLLAKAKIEKIKDLPDGMREVLESSGIRLISPIVDLTNYVMIETGQPLHAFDAAKVKLPLTVRYAQKGEKLVTLDGVERTLAAADVVIADESGPIALAGIMGGLNTEVTDSTKEILLESATFSAPEIRKTAVRHGLRTEASSRYERGLPVHLADFALQRAALLLDQMGVKEMSVIADELTVWPWVQHVGVRESRIARLYGERIPASRIVSHLRALGFTAEEFDIAAEARKHLGKPYVWGASFKKNGTEAFDCSYLLDYIYSRIGVAAGHTAAQLFEFGRAVDTSELRPGDAVFRDGPWEKLDKAERKGVSHVALYVGDGKIIHAKDTERDSKGEWRKLPEPERMVVEEPVERVTQDPDFLGARRFTDNLPDFIAVTAPWWRPDIKTEEDILEEIARVEGYDKLPSTLPVWHPQDISFDRLWQKIWSVKAVLKSLQLFEVVTYSFISASQLNRFGRKPEDHLKVKNPLSTEQEYLRQDLLPSLATVASRNTAYAKTFGIYEISKVFLPQRSHKELPTEELRLGILFQTEKKAYPRVKQALESLEEHFHLQLKIERSDAEGFFPGRSGKLVLNGENVGVIGELHPDVLRDLKISGNASYLEIALSPLFSSEKIVQATAKSKFPSIRRDLSLLLPIDVSWQDVREAVTSLELARPSFLSDYYSENLPAGIKSMAVRLDMESSERTLTEQEANDRANQILKKLSRKFGAKLKED